MNFRLSTLSAVLLLALTGVASAAIVKFVELAITIPGLDAGGIPSFTYPDYNRFVLKGQFDDTTRSFVAKAKGKVGNASGSAARQVTMPFSGAFEVPGPEFTFVSGSADSAAGTAVMQYGKPDKKVPPQSSVSAVIVGTLSPQM